jgi:hypothetical protein
VSLMIRDEKGVRHVTYTCCLSSAVLFLSLVLRVKIWILVIKVLVGAEF